MTDWLAVLLPLVAFALFFVLLRRSTQGQPKADISKRQLRLAHLLIPVFMLGVIVVGSAANVSPVIAFAVIFIGVLLILRLLHKQAAS
jgi:hypothetical protein